MQLLHMFHNPFSRNASWANTKHSFWLMILCAAIVAFAPLPALSQSEEGSRSTRRAIAESQAIAADFLRTELALSPETATRLGLERRLGPTATSALDNHSQAGFERRRLVRIELLQRLRSRPVLAEDHPLTLDLAIAETALTDLIELEQFGFGRFSYRDHRPYAIDPYSGIWIEGPNQLAFRQSINTAVDASAYLVRLHGLSEALHDTRRRLVADRAAGIYLPLELARETQDRLRKIVSDDPTALYRLVSTFEALMRDVPDLEPGERDMMLQLVRNEVDLVLRPAYLDLIETLSETSDDFADQVGIWALPDGTAVFGHILDAANGAPVNSETLHTRFVEQTARQKQKLESLLVVAAAAEDETPPMPPEALAERIVWFVDANTNPASEIEAATDINAPDVLANYAPKMVWQRLAVDPSFPAQARAWQRYVDLFLAAPYSAWSPGSDLPEHRQILEFTAIQEAIRWYLWETSAIAATPLDYAAHVQTTLIQQALATVDTGLHLERWSLEEAIDYLVETTGLAPDTSRDLVLSVIARPGFHAAIAVAHGRVSTLAERARAVLGERYVELDFQRALLRPGPRPLPILEKDIETWYADQLAN